MHWFIDPIKNHYADFSGRVARKEYWMFILVYTIISIILSIIFEIVHLGWLIFIFYLAILIPSIAIAARRLHDINKSGWWQLIGLIPFIGFIILIVMLATPTRAGDNKYVTGSVPVPEPAPQPDLEKIDSEEETKL